MVDRQRLKYMGTYSGRLARHSLLHPLDGAERIKGRVDMRLDGRRWGRLGLTSTDVYNPVEDWPEKLHAALGTAWPCSTAPAFQGVWDEAVEAVRAAGAKPGTAAYGGWCDGDYFFAQAAWCSVEHLRPGAVVETGVGHGLVTAVILDRLSSAQHGHLWSIDLPEIVPTVKARTGVAVAAPLRARWSYVEGTSRQRLLAVLAALPEGLGVFLHDSLHTTSNVRFELDAAWERLRPGGVLLVDDVQMNFGFHWFLHAAHPAASFVAPDAVGGGMWGFARKD